MYSDLKNIQILVSLLKKYDINHIVISAGTRHTPFIYSVEHDKFFKTYSIVDERSASFFALGLIEELHKPVAICCTSGTAAANYVSAANEAFYQQLPLLILTADRNHFYMFQQEEQMIPQENLYSAVCKKVVTLNHVRDDKDFWHCSRLCNEALIELRHREDGPVHINFIVENNYPIINGIVKFTTYKLPDVRKIDLLTLEDSEEKWKVKAEKLKKSSILIVYGQHRPLTEKEKNIVVEFTEKYNCVISVDLLSNLLCNSALPTFTLCRCLNQHELEKLLPDILITMNANSVTEIKGRMSPFKDKFEHWHVSSKGEVSDPLKCLPDVVECSPITFFKKFSDISDSISSHSYLKKWQHEYERVGFSGCLNDVDVSYSSMYAVQQLVKRIPENSLLHIANSNSIRIANYFSVPDNVAVYGNRGTNGIDGSMSAFIGQAHIRKKLSFLIIGDLSFFYDMNALWNQYVGNNIRVLVCNNSGGAIFHSFPNTKNVPSLDEHIAAAHTTSVRGWVESRGFLYHSAHNKEELDKAILFLLCEKSEKPVLLEAFTDKEIDVKCLHNILVPYSSEKSETIKGIIGRHISTSTKEKIKKILK